MIKLKDGLFTELIEIEVKIRKLKKKGIKKRLVILKKRKLELRKLLNLKDKVKPKKYTNKSYN